jgi:hypothetical protein
MKTMKIHDFYSKLAIDILPSNDLKIEIVSQSSPNRHEVENFIADSFQNHFDAKLKSFFPLILTIRKIKTNGLIAAVGIRCAKKEQLFSECYLDESIEQTIVKLESTLTSRGKIAELGNFVVKNRSDIKQVIPVLGKFIKTLNVDWVIYTLTRPIKEYFHKLGIKLNHIVDADISKVNGAAKDWGRYYNFKPAVYYSSVNANLN